ncbi:hypothetical protein E4T66_14345 [Sinimarinibacterium sp. CAU 1509]|uniref:LPS translocon maturation chaperone LptM n=1 Tax=Sinimarinibacterium sp. CAU 1509 TaxID=2562283 RepID=UPI0010ACA3EB|nr:lipoprotein [Sinimarinibacterium sp. CAU 1509]TJY58780.1 hypothetical protein E4T66_14345 [Sinimarinibacterium sp. CAU 1509]
MIDRRLIAASLLLCLTACGQSGALVLPDEDEAVIPAPAPTPAPTPVPAADSSITPERSDAQTAPTDR